VRQQNLDRIDEEGAGAVLIMIEGKAGRGRKERERESRARKCGKPLRGILTLLRTNSARMSGPEEDEEEGKKNKSPTAGRKNGKSLACGIWRASERAG